MLCILPALQEAAEGYTQLELIRKNKDEKIAKLCYSKPRKYKYIKVNYIVDDTDMKPARHDYTSISYQTNPTEKNCKDLHKL